MNTPAQDLLSAISRLAHDTDGQSALANLGQVQGFLFHWVNSVECRLAELKKADEETRDHFERANI